MPIQTNIKFRKFLKAIEVCASRKYAGYQIIPKRGSARRIELFQKKEDKEPCNFWVVHEDRYVWSGDLKKAYMNLGVSKKEFLDIIKSL